uniref:Uncharacterized protein n=1 Tax=Arundo donax TaxID=35708 RepID=A0A0A9DE18_ARUDO
MPRSAATEPPKECPTISILYPWHSQPSPRREDKNPPVIASVLSRCVGCPSSFVYSSRADSTIPACP